MFELFSGDRHRAPHRSSIPVLISTAAHVIVLGVLLAIPILYISDDLPEIPDMLTFVVVSAAPPPPPPPPPPPAAPTAKPSKPKVTKPVPTTSPRAAPVEAPPEIVMLATVPMSLSTAGSAYQLSRILTKSRIFERPHDMIH